MAKKTLKETFAEECQETERIVKQELIAEERGKFSRATRLEDIHYDNFDFFENVELWGLLPIRFIVDAIENNQNEPEALGVLINDIQLKMDTLIDNFKRWREEQVAFETEEKPDRPFSIGEEELSMILLRVVTNVPANDKEKAENPKLWATVDSYIEFNNSMKSKTD